LWKALLKWVTPRRATPTGEQSAAAVQPQATDAAQPQATEPELPAGVDGLDVAAGLRRVLGKRRLYLSMLRRFVAGQKLAVAGIRKALADEDRESAERLAHTLKGVAGNIGATGLQLLAAGSEKAIREGEPRAAIDERLAALAIPLATLIAQLEGALPQETGKTVSGFDAKRLKTVCDRLEALMADDDAQAADVLDENADILRKAFPAGFQAIDRAIRSFDYDAALVALRSATASPGGGGSP
jgi:HPt (histidine-containing phosphotransfer) domain-containing protein